MNLRDRAPAPGTADAVLAHVRAALENGAPPHVLAAYGPYASVKMLGRGGRGVRAEFRVAYDAASGVFHVTKRSGARHSEIEIWEGVRSADLQAIIR